MKVRALRRQRMAMGMAYLRNPNRDFRPIGWYARQIRRGLAPMPIAVGTVHGVRFVLATPR